MTTNADDAVRPLPGLSVASDRGIELRVVFIARHYWPRPGAATIRLQALVRAWVSRGDDVYVITVASADLTSSTIGPDGERIVPVVGDTETGVGVGRIVRLIWFAISAGWQARRLHPTIVVADPPPTSGLAAMHCGAKVAVYYIADSWALMLSEANGSLAQLLAKVVRPLENHVLRRSDVVIAVRENLGRQATLAGSRNTTVAPYGTDLNTFRPDGPIWADPWNGDLPYFLYAGNYGVIQGATVFLDAAARLWVKGHRFGLVFMGYGADESAVAALATRYPEQFRSLPPVDASVAASAYRGAVAALASMRPVAVADETRPAKALAASACGCPLVYAGSGTFVRQVNTEGLGIGVPWVESEVADAMSSVLSAWQNDAELHAAWRTRAATYAWNNYDMGPAAQRLIETILHQMDAGDRQARDRS